MLEHDLSELFESQAREDPPPTRASLAAATRRGRSRLRRRRAVSIAAPLMAAMTVLAIAVAGTLLTPTSAPTRAAQSQSRRLPSLSLWPLWLPPGMHVTSALAYHQHQENLSITKGDSLAGSIGTFSGPCTASQSKLSCGKTSWGPLEGLAGMINGFRGYWSASGLLFEWAQDRWADVQFPTRPDDLRVARHLTMHAPPIRYPFQLTGSWPGAGVQSVGSSYVHGRAVADAITLAPVAELNPPVTVPFQDIVQVDVGPVGSTPPCISSGTHEVINGYHVDVAWIDRHGTDPIQDVCASDADGLLVRSHSYGTRLFASAPMVFAHLRLFGPDPAKWPATPFG
jgi:hypothetical protein